MTAQFLEIDESLYLYPERRLPVFLLNAQDIKFLDLLKIGIC